MMIKHLVCKYWSTNLMNYFDFVFVHGKIIFNYQTGNDK